jgi:hypothetical protein
MPASQTALRWSAKVGLVDGLRLAYTDFQRREYDIRKETP